MRLDIILVSPNSGHLKAVCSDLRRSKMDVLQLESVQEMKAGLALHSPAFLLLDLGVKDSMAGLKEVSNGLYQPRPYVLVSAAFHNGGERAQVLRLGADVCVDEPINTEEVLAVIYAVYRREQWTVRYGQGRQLPRIEHKDAELLRLLYFEEYSQEECAKKLKITTRTVRRIKDDAIDELAEMYSFTASLANKACPETVQ